MEDTTKDLFPTSKRLEAATHAPLAERMRPKRLGEVVGQDHLLGPGRFLREVIECAKVPSLILWGPPGVGKTTLARLLAGAADYPFVALSAVSRVRKRLPLRPR